MTTETIISLSSVVVALLVGGFGWIITDKFNRNSIKHYEQTQKIENDRMMKELFTEFNQRYDKINNKLDTITELSVNDWEKLKSKDKEKIKGVVIDFFNICSEEYYWHKHDRINGDIWVSWFKGMNDIYNKSEFIQHVWEQESLNERYKSYYITSKNEFFKNA